MVVGVGLSGVLTSFLAQWLVRSRQGNGAMDQPSNPP